MQAPSDCCDVSFLLETNHLEEQENVSAKERFIKQQKEQLEKERQRLMDFAAEIAEQVSIPGTLVRSHRVQGSIDPHFFEYTVHMWRLTPLFVSYSDFDPHFTLPSAASDLSQLFDRLCSLINAVEVCCTYRKY